MDVENEKLPGDASDTEHSVSHVQATDNDNESRPLLGSVSLMEQSITSASGMVQTTNMQSLMHLLKGNIGTGILAMPSALKYAGLWVGTGGLFVIGAIAIHCMHLLVNCSHHLCEKTGCQSLDYGEVAQEAFRVGPAPLRNYYKAAKNTVNVFLVITQMGFCTVYVLFVATNISQVVDAALHLPAHESPLLNIRLYEFFIFIALFIYVILRNLKILAPFSFIANILTVVGLGIILVYCFQDLPPSSTYPAFNSWATLPMYFGIAIYAFEGIGVILPIENKMKHPEDLGGWTGVLNLGMVITTCLYIAVGFYGFMKFGGFVQGSITLNLPYTSWLYLSVRLMFALSIFITYGLQFYVPVQIIWSVCKYNFPVGTFWRSYGEYFLRVVLLILSFTLAIVIPHLDLMISLIGALASSTLALIFPPILEIITLYPDNKITKAKIVLNVCISLFGFFGFVSGTITTLIKIVDKFKTGS